MAPDDAPALGTQPEPQFAPPHVRSRAGRWYRPALTLYLPGSQSMQTLDAPQYCPASHFGAGVDVSAGVVEGVLVVVEVSAEGRVKTLQFPTKPRAA
jgi:hypothetical protein